MLKLTESATIAYEKAHKLAGEGFARGKPLTVEKSVAEEHVDGLKAAIKKLLGKSSRNTAAAMAAGRYQAELERFEEYLK